MNRPFAAGDGVQRRPVRRLAEQVDADQRARAQLAVAPHLGDALLQMRRIDLEGARIDIDEHRRRAQHQRHLGGRGVGEGGQEHRVAAADAFRHHGDLQRVGAGTDRHAMLRAAELRQFGFQFGHLGAEDELAMRQHRVQPPAQVGGDARLLRLQVEERDRQGGSVMGDLQATGMRVLRRCVRTPGPGGRAGSSASRAWPPRQAAAISSIARPTMAGSAVRGDAISRPG